MTWFYITRNDKMLKKLTNCGACIHYKKGKCQSRNSVYYLYKRKKSDLACKQFEND